MATPPKAPYRRPMMVRLPASLSLACGLAFVTACGGGSPPAEAPKPAEEKPAPIETAAPAPQPEEKTAPAPSATAEATPGDDAAPKNDLKGRNITYRMTPSGLVIEVEGVEFVPQADAVKTQGGYDIMIKVKATARDGQLHRLLSPENGPLMVFAKIDRGGKVTETPDVRKGDGEEFIAADDTITLERKFNTNVNPGTTVTLQVGLWGLSQDAADRRPVKKLFFLKMAGGQKKPAPVITAPE
jgi:hypothetical protein